MIYKIATLGIMLLLLMVGYALLVIASRAEERADRMYKRWKDERSNNKADK